MTNNKTRGVAASDFVTECLTRERDRARQRAALRPGNRRILFEALNDAGITTVTAQFDGVGDEGQIESITAISSAGNVALPATPIIVRQLAADAIIDTERRIEEAIEVLVYELLEETHPGWEINAGAFGTFTFDVAARTIRLEHSARIEDTFDSTHDF